MKHTEMDRVIIYRREILPPSETFILSQVRALRRYQAHFVGPLRAAAGLPLGKLPLHTLGTGTAARLGELAFRYAGYAPSLDRAARDLHPALIHAHFALDGAESMPLAERLRIPLVVTLHGWDVTMSDAEFRKNWRGRRFLARRRELQRIASVFLCVSKFIRDEAAHKGFPPEKLLVHPIGIDTNKLVPSPLMACENIVLFVGRLVEKKGLSYLLRAMARVRDARLAVIGDGPLRAQHQAEAIELGVACEFLGEQPNGAVHEWMGRASVLAVPSVRAKSGDSEGLPTVILEAFAAGLPVAAFDSAGIPEAVSENCGMLAKERDFEQLARHLDVMLHNADLRSRLAIGARRCAEQNFDIARQTEKLERIYDGLAGKANSDNNAIVRAAAV